MPDPTIVRPGLGSRSKRQDGKVLAAPGEADRPAKAFPAVIGVAAAVGVRR